MIRVGSMWSFTDSPAAPPFEEGENPPSNARRRKDYTRSGLGIRYKYYLVPLLVGLLTYAQF